MRSCTYRRLAAPTETNAILPITTIACAMTSSLAGVTWCRVARAWRAPAPRCRCGSSARGRARFGKYHVLVRQHIERVAIHALGDAFGFLEAATQVMGRAGDHQVDGARIALGHAYGGGSQYFSMWVVGSAKPE